VILIGDHKEMIVVMGRSKRGPFSVACFGTKRHYRKDGTCKHLEAIVANLRTWHRRRTVVYLYGDNDVTVRCQSVPRLAAIPFIESVTVE